MHEDEMQHSSATILVGAKSFKGTNENRRNTIHRKQPLLKMGEWIKIKKINLKTFRTK